MNANHDDISNRLRASLGANEAPTLSADLVTGAAERPAPHVVNNARRVATAGGLTLAVAAVATVALVVTSPFAQDPLFTAAGTGGTSEMSAAADSRLMMWTNYEYLPGASLSTQGGSGHVYQLQRTGTPQEVLEAAAAALGVDGTPAESSYFDPTYPAYVIGPEDGTAPSVVVSWSGTGNWSYNDPTAYPQMTCNADGVCESPVATASLAPSESEARAIAAEIFSATGLDVAEGDITVYSDEWQTTATANLVVNGTKTALDWGVGWSSTGVMSYAYGHSVKVVDKGSYDTVSATAAVDRLDDWRWSGAGGPEYQGGAMLYATSDLARSSDVMPATDTPVAVDPAVPTEAPADPGVTEPSEPSVDPTVEPLPEPTLVDPMPEPMPTPETVVVTVDEAHATLLLLWDSEGNAWLVPGYAMPHPDGWFSTVVSLIDGVITLPEPIAIEPMDGEIAY